MASSVHVFKEVCQRTNFSQITYKASSGMEREKMHVVDWNSGIYRCIMGKTLKIFFSEKMRPTAYRFMSWIIYVISVLVLLCFRARMFIDALWSPVGKGLSSWLSFVMSNCEVVTFPLVSWVRCGAWLYRFLIFAPFLTLWSAIHALGVYTSHGVISFYW